MSVALKAMQKLAKEISEQAGKKEDTKYENGSRILAKSYYYDNLPADVTPEQADAVNDYNDQYVGATAIIASEDAKDRLKEKGDKMVLEAQLPGGSYVAHTATHTGENVEAVIDRNFAIRDSEEMQSILKMFKK